MNMQTNPMALPVVHLSAPAARKPLPKLQDRIARAAIILEHILGYHSAPVPDEVQEVIGPGDWKTPGIKAMAKATGMSMGSVVNCVQLLRAQGLIEGYVVRTQATQATTYLRVVDPLNAWFFIDKHEDRVLKLKAGKAPDGPY